MTSPALITEMASPALITEMASPPLIYNTQKKLKKQVWSYQWQPVQLKIKLDGKGIWLEVVFMVQSCFLN